MSKNELTLQECQKLATIYKSVLTENTADLMISNMFKGVF